MSNTRIPLALRQRVAELFRYRCGYCLTSQRIIGPLLEIDHYIPESRGGSSEEDNLCLACPMCNNRKSDRVTVVDPESHAVVPLFNPCQQQWEAHFAWTVRWYGGARFDRSWPGYGRSIANEPPRYDCGASALGFCWLASTERLIRPRPPHPHTFQG